MRRILRMSSAGAAICSSRHFDLLEDLLDDLFRSQVLGLGLVGQGHAMSEHVVGHRLHVLGSDEATVLEEGVRPGRQVQVDGGAGGGAVLDVSCHLLEAMASRRWQDTSSTAP